MTDPVLQIRDLVTHFTTRAVWYGPWTA